MGKISKQLIDWIYVTTLQLSTMAKDVRLLGGLKHNGPQCEATRSDCKRYRIGMAEKIEVALGTDDSSRLFDQAVMLRMVATNQSSLRLAKQASLSLNSIKKSKEGQSTLINFLIDLSTKKQTCHLQFDPHHMISIMSSKSQRHYEGRQSKNGKVIEEDSTLPEVHKTCLPLLISMLHKIFRSTWERQLVPSN